MLKSEEIKIDAVLNRLSKSKFRNSFHLSNKDLEYIREKNLDTIKNHAYDFIGKRLASKNIDNDGKQTPMRGHPVFIAQHATATCCRECLKKWHNIKKENSLTEEQIEYVVNVIMKWINLQLECNNK